MLLALAGLGFSGCFGSSAAREAPSRTDSAASGSGPDVSRCIVQAASYHRVNPSLLRAILQVESSLNPRALGRNLNGTIDLGIGQINSMHLPLLSRYGLQAGHLLDPCIGSYVAAWHLASVLATHGNTWESVARYHSATPHLNWRYRVLLHNQLVAQGVIAGQRLPVPPLLGKPLPARSRARTAEAAVAATALVLDVRE